MKEEIQAIAKTRMNYALGGLVFAQLLLVGGVLQTSVTFAVIALSYALVVLPALVLIGVNYKNSKQLRLGYRVFNKYVYIYGAKVGIVYSVLVMLMSLKKAANPFRALNPKNESAGSMLLQAGVSSLTAASMYASLPTAQKVDYYFSHQHQLESAEQAVPEPTQSPQL